MSTTPTPTPTPKPVVAPVMIIPLQCAMCGNRLSSVYNAATANFTHVHQAMPNAPACPVTGKKYQIGHNGVEEVHA